MTVAVTPVLSPDLRTLLDRQGSTVAAEVATLRNLMPEILEPGDSPLWAAPAYRTYAARIAWKFSEAPNLAPHP